MFARIRKAQENNEGGFTLIELLVVMIIIGILAAIAIPAFLNQREKAKETAAKSDATNISKEISAALVDGPFQASSGSVSMTDGTGPDGTLRVRTTADAAPVDIAVKISSDVTVVASNSSTTVYCVTATVTGGAAWSAGPNGLIKGSTCA